MFSEIAIVFPKFFHIYDFFAYYGNERHHRKEQTLMRLIVIKSPKLLSPILRKIFRVKKA